MQQAAAPVILFQGAGLSSSSAAVVSPQKDEEFDYAFDHDLREVHATRQTVSHHQQQRLAHRTISASVQHAGLPLAVLDHLLYMHHSTLFIITIHRLSAMLDTYQVCPNLVPPICTNTMDTKLHPKGVP